MAKKNEKTIYSKTFVFSNSFSFFCSFSFRISIKISNFNWPGLGPGRLGGRDGLVGPSPGQLKFEICQRVFSCPHGPTKNIFEGFLAVRMALPKTFLMGFYLSAWPYRKHFWVAFSCPHGPTKNIFERLLPVRMALLKIFLSVF